jgi:hypothetical protein
MGVVGMKTFFVPLLISIGLLSSCASTSGSSSSNFVCASVEQYLDNKAFALESAATGGSAEESISAIVGQLSQSVGDDSEARLIFEKFLDSMTVWSQIVDSYVLTQNKEDLASAAAELEKQIDEIVPLCEASGWSFQNGWR